MFHTPSPLQETPLEKNFRALLFGGKPARAEKHQPRRVVFNGTPAKGEKVANADHYYARTFIFLNEPQTSIIGMSSLLE